MKKAIKIILILLMCIVSSYFFLIAISEPPRIYHPNQIELYDIDEKQIYSRIKDNFSNYININEISEPFKITLIEIEDQHFYSHNGVDYKRILKSFFINLKNQNNEQGASTITQQLARLLYLSNEKTYKRKFKELIIAKKFEANYTKDQILEFYINTIYFGHNLYGIDAASKYYFNKSPLYLDYKEASILVGIINSPNKYAPDINKDLCIKKSNSILKKLYERNILDKENYNYYLEKEVTFSLKSNNEYINFLYYQDAVINELNKRKISSKNTLLKGYSITTYLDRNIQKNILNTVNKYKKELNENEDISIVIMEANSSKVLGLIGGSDYSKSTFNRAISSYRQVGSTIKPLLYYLALENGFTPLSTFRSEETSFNIRGIGEYSPKNAGERYGNRDINMIEAIALSDNIYATKTILLLGSKNFASLINRFNIEVNDINPTLALGNIDLSLLQLVSIYNTFASNGKYYVPSFIKEVKSQEGNSIYTHKEEYQQLLNSQSSTIINYLLRSPFDKALQSYATPSLMSYQTKARFSAKTGTTDYSSYVIGYNPKYTIGVYIGNDINNELSNTRLSKQIFVDIANKLCPEEKENFFFCPNTCKKFSLINKTNNMISFNYIKKKNLF